MRRKFALAPVGAVALTIVTSGASSGAKQLKVAFMTDLVKPAGARDLRAIAYQGFLRAVRDFRIEGRIVQLDAKRGPRPTLVSLAQQKYDLVFTGQARSFGDVDAVAAVARKFPQTKFVMTDPPVLKPWPNNVQGSVWRIEQPAYLAGYLAALVERRRPGKDVIGSVGGFPIALVDTFIAGYEAGARRASPSIRTLVDYAFSFFDPAKCKSVALKQIAKGAGVIFNVGGACGLGTMDAVKERGAWAVGVDVDQSFLGPHILTSVLKRFDVAVYETIEALVKRRLRTGGNRVWSLRNGGVGLGQISPKVPRSFVRKVERIRAQIVAGKIKVPDRLK